MSTNTHEHPAAERLVSLSRVALELDVSTATVRRWCRTGLLPSVKLVSGARRVRREHVSALVIDPERKDGQP